MTKPMSRFNVEVTDKDIERAHRSDSYRCVVVQAIARTIPDATHIDVDTQAIRFTRDGARFIYLTPYAVQGYVIAFDAGDPIEPFSFQLRNPQRVARRLRTETGKEAVRAYGHAASKGFDPITTGSKDIPTKTKPAKAKTAPTKQAANADARAAYAAVSAKAKEPLTTMSGRKAPPRVFKSSRRSYGHRLLRINQVDIDGAS